MAVRGNCASMHLFNNTWAHRAALAFGWWHFRCAILSVVKSVLGEPRHDVICVAADSDLYVLWALSSIDPGLSISHTENIGCQEAVWQPAFVCLCICRLAKRKWKVLNRFYWNFHKMLDSGPENRCLHFSDIPISRRDTDLWSWEDQRWCSKPRGSDLLPRHTHTHTHARRKISCLEEVCALECFSSR